MTSTKQRAALALAAIAAIGICAAGVSSYRQLSATRADAAAAWEAVGTIHAARASSASDTLDDAAKVRALAAADVERARAMLSQARALDATPALLDNPQAFDTYKRYQGELGGALFGLAFGATTPDAAAVLEQLRSALPRSEAALAQARARYKQAADRHNALAASLPGAAVALITGNGIVPPAL